MRNPGQNGHSLGRKLNSGAPETECGVLNTGQQTQLYLSDIEVDTQEAVL
jgi:hypothetical protein